jgi:Helix-turn-helix domain of resolvase
VTVARLPQINTQACRRPYSLLDMAALSDLLGRSDADPRRRGRPRKLTPDNLALAERMRASGEPVPVIAQTLRVSTPTMYRLLAERTKRAAS